MKNIKKINFLYLAGILSISFPIFSGNVNQGMSNQTQEANENQNEPIIRSELKRRYKPETENEIANQEEIVDIAKLKIPLRALCLNRILDTYIFEDKDKSDENLTDEEIGKLKIDKKEFQNFVKSKDLLPLLKMIQEVKKAGYRNKKLVQELIKLTIRLSDSNFQDLPDSDLKELAEMPSIDDLRSYFVEAVFLGDANAVSLLLSQNILKRTTNIETEKEICHIDDIETILYRRAFYKDEHNDISDIAYENYKKANNSNWTIRIITEKALCRATRKNYLEIVKILLDEIEFPSYAIDQGLSYAKTKEMISIYLAKKANLNSPCDWSSGAGCLGTAVEHLNMELVDFLLENGASPLSSLDEISPLTCVLKKMENEDPLIKEQGKQLLEKFAHHSPETFLISIAQNDHIEEEILKEAMIIALNTKLININEQHEEDGWNALMVAANRLLYHIVVFLIKKGADISLKNDENQTVLEIARANLDRYRFDINTEEITQSIVNLLEMTEQMNKMKDKLEINES